MKLIEVAGMKYHALLLLNVWMFVNGSNNIPRFASFLQVCDMYLKYNLPLLIMPPAGVFYPALLSMDSVSLNQLCYIMYRYYKWCGLWGILLSFVLIFWINFGNYFVKPEFEIYTFSYCIRQR